MRPRLGPASAALHANAIGRTKSLDASVGVTGAGHGTTTPTRNAIELSSPVALDAPSELSELSPWRSVLPPQGGGGDRL